MNVAPTSLAVPVRQNRRDSVPLPGPRAGEAPVIPDRQRARTVPDEWAASRMSREQIVSRGLEVFPTSRAMRMSGLKVVLDWLEQMPGETWQQRWLASGADAALRDWPGMVATGTGRRGGGTARPVVVRSAVHALLALDVVRPSMEWMLDQHFHFAIWTVLKARDPEAQSRMEAGFAAHDGIGGDLSKACAAVTRIMMVKGGTLADITVGDCVEYWEARRAVPRKVTEGVLFYTLLFQLGVFGPDAPPNLMAATRRGRLSCEELVDRFGIECAPIRALLIDYLGVRRPGMDYTSLTSLAANLGMLFWRDLELHHPGIASLHLDPPTVAAWKQRLGTISYDPGRAGRAREVPEVVLTHVRAFYLDVNAWAAAEPARWGPLSAPCPVSPAEVSLKKVRRRRKAEKDQRTRALAPVLPALVAAAAGDLRAAQALLDGARAVPHGHQFTVDGQTYTRVDPTAHPENGRIYAVAAGTTDRVDLRYVEERAFWTWAAVEVLRHTGIRIEEMLELTHHSFAAYTLPTTGEVVPLLQIAPSKTDTERVLLVSPELGEVLARIIARVRGTRAAIPLISLWDTPERQWSPLQPFLFQRPKSGVDRPVSGGYLRQQLQRLAAEHHLAYADGTALRFTPHDFRRIFATDALRAGLPPHIAAKVLGHQDVNVTLGYAAIYPEDVITHHRAYIARRRSLRPSEEYRELTAKEWTDFLGHFELRKVELGICTRDFGTPCIHEHACVRCPALRPDPDQQPRLAAILDNLHERLAEARHHGWGGEIAGLEVSIEAATRKMHAMDELRRTHQVTHLGMPDFRGVVGRDTAGPT